MKFVVTGGAGFIGSHLTAALLGFGHDTVVVDNFFSGRRENLEDARARAGDSDGNLEVVETDILDSAVVTPLLQGADAVFHQAAIASVPRSFADPAPTLRANVEGTARLLEGCRTAGVGTFVMASSSSVYGDTPTLPKQEDMAPCPLSPYALSKLAGEHLLQMWSAQHGMRTVGLRYFNVFGPRQDPASEYAAVIPKFVTRILDGKSPIVYGDGLQSRDFTYIDNAVAANLLAAGIDPVTGQPRPVSASGVSMNVGVGGRYTLLELVEGLNEILGTTCQPELAAPRAGDVRHSQASIDRARELIGYEPAVDFRTGLERTVAWFVERFENRAAAVHTG